MELLISLDHALFKLINQSWSNGFFDQLFPIITDLHKTIYFKITLLILIFGIHFYKSGKKGILIGFMCLFSLGLSDWTGNQFFKKPINRERPFEFSELQTIQRSNAQPGSSFVSNHAANMFALASFNFYLVPITGVVLFPFAAIAAYSRVYNGVHFPLDVLGGAVWGSLVGLLISFLCFKFLLTSKKASK